MDIIEKTNALDVASIQDVDLHKLLACASLGHQVHEMAAQWHCNFDRQPNTQLPTYNLPAYLPPTGLT